jgi:hypothetical protein
MTEKSKINCWDKSLHRLCLEIKSVEVKNDSLKRSIINWAFTGSYWGVDGNSVIIHTAFGRTLFRVDGDVVSTWFFPHELDDKKSGFLVYFTVSKDWLTPLGEDLRKKMDCRTSFETIYQGKLAEELEHQNAARKP